MMMVPDMKANGKMISKKDKDKKVGQTDHNLQVYIKMGRKFKVFSSGLMVQCMMASSKKDRCMG